VLVGQKGGSRTLKSRNHILLFLAATCVWAVFLIGGLPSYYQQYSKLSMVLFDIVVLVPITGVAYLVLRGVGRERRLNVSAWIAFYFTVPLAIYDWLYCGVFLGHGMQFLGRFWYLSVYYAIPWVLMPMVALVLNHWSERASGHDGST
jgi:hypothetical protein